MSPEPAEYEIALRLRDLAGAVESAGTTPVNVHATVQYSHGKTIEVEHVASLVEAPAPAHRQVAGGWHHNSETRGEHLRVVVFCGVDEPAEAKRDRLRQELAELDAQIGDGSLTEAAGLISGPVHGHPLPEPAS